MRLLFTASGFSTSIALCVLLSHALSLSPCVRFVTTSTTLMVFGAKQPPPTIVSWTSCAASHWRRDATSLLLLHYVYQQQHTHTHMHHIRQETPSRSLTFKDVWRVFGFRLCSLSLSIPTSCSLFPILVCCLHRPLWRAASQPGADLSVGPSDAYISAQKKDTPSRKTLEKYKKYKYKL